MKSVSECDLKIQICICREEKKEQPGKESKSEQVNMRIAQSQGHTKGFGTNEG